MKTVSSREFNQGVSQVKRATENGPVFITDRGRLAHVLMKMEDYQKLTDQKGNIVTLLAMSGDVDFEPRKIEGKLYHAEDYE
tara:strand:- start:815 stop:1060 length:246 start_codon:yes stop_codon:yes gene_type:complete